MTPPVAPRTLPDLLRGLSRSATADCGAVVDARFAPMVARLGSSIAVRRAPEREIAGAMAAHACLAGRVPDVHVVEAADAG